MRGSLWGPRPQRDPQLFTLAVLVIIGDFRANPEVNAIFTILSFILASAVARIIGPIPGTPPKETAGIPRQSGSRAITPLWRGTAISSRPGRRPDFRSLRDRGPRRSRQTGLCRRAHGPDRRPHNRITRSW